MFASLKNKIREETGSDISKLTSKISSSTSSVQQRLESLRGRHSRQGSTSSINSLVSLDGIREDISSSTDSKTEEEVRRRLSKVELEHSRKFEEIENEWKEKFEQQEKRIKQLETEKENVIKIASELREQLSVAEGYRQKLFQFQEEKEQLENFQTQEIAKVKHLVLLREQELAEKTSSYKDCLQQLEKLRTEVNRLRRQEEVLSDVQESCNTESDDLRKKLTDSINDFCNLEAEKNKLLDEINKQSQTNDDLRLKINKLEETLTDERSHSLDIQKELKKEISEKNEAFLRNAEISQKMEIIKQDSRHKENEITELLSKITQLETLVAELKQQQSKENVENDLRTQIADLEEQLTDKNKNIKTLQMRLNDMKKTLQQELRSPSQASEESNVVAVISPSQSTTKHSHNSHCQKDEDDINFKYLKHVIIKFLTSREYEAQHLTRAVSTLLKFSPDEEKLLHDTLEWKMSWFGTRPNLGIGQTAKAIPPS